MSMQIGRPPRIVVLLQGIAGPGGVQRHGRTLCRALREYAAAGAAELDVLAFSDPDGWHDARLLDRPLRGSAGRRAHFVARALAALSRPHDLVIVGQVDFGPIVLLSRLLGARAPALALTYGIEVWRRLPPHKLLALRAAERVSTISAYTAQQLVELQALAPAKIELAPCTLDPEFVQAAADTCVLAQPGPPIHLLSVARLSRRDADKGIDQVISALPAIRGSLPALRYTVIGDGDDRPRLEALARSLGVAEQVRFAGHVDEAELRAAFARAELFVMPSRKEGFGLVFLEAMAYGKPVIAGAHGGSPEVVAHGETGLLVPHGDSAALAAAALELLGNPAQRAAMGAAGRRRVEEVFSYRCFAARLATSLDSLLGNAAGTALSLGRRS